MLYAAKYNPQKTVIDELPEKYNALRIFYIWSSTKLNPREKPKIYRSQNWICAKINSLKVGAPLKF